MKRQLALCVAVAALACGPAAAGEITPGVPACLPTGGNGVVSATLTPETGWSNVRVYFREAGTGDFYFLEMRSDGAGEYWAALPKPATGTQFVEVYTLAVAGDGSELKSPVTTVPVLSSCSPDLTPEQVKYAQNLVVGETSASQAGGKVAGFMCDGIVWRIAADGDFQNDEACHDEMLAAAATETTPQVTKYLVPLVLGGIGADVLISDDPCPPISPCVPCPLQ